MHVVKVPGHNRSHKVRLYTLSTCAWCRKTKKFLNENHIEYEYVDVDRCNSEEREQIRREILEKGGRLSYPVIVIDDKMLINGFRKDRIQETLEI